MDLVDSSPVPRQNTPGITSGELLRRRWTRSLSEREEHGDDPLLGVTRGLADLETRSRTRREPCRSQAKLTPGLLKRDASSTVSLRRITGNNVIELLGRRH